MARMTYFVPTLTCWALLNHAGRCKTHAGSDAPPAPSLSPTGVLNIEGDEDGVAAEDAAGNCSSTGRLAVNSARPSVMKLHGREAEQQVIDGLLASARAGRSRAVVVRGAAGIGKTALLGYAAAAAAANGMLVLRTAGVETEAEFAFSGLHLLLRPVLGYIGSLPGPQAAALRGALGLSERGSQDRFLAGLAVLSLLSELAEDRPVLCLIDDAHWLDAASADVLLFAARRLEAEGVVMLLAARDGPPRFAARGLCHLTLGPLTSQVAGQLLAERAGYLPPALRERVLTEADGNPLALVELAAALTAGSAAAGAGPLPVTHSVQELLADQIGRLGEPAALVLLLAAAE